jgi:hypothetical protein
MAACARTPPEANAPTAAPAPVTAADSIAFACASAGSNGSAACPTSEALVLTPQLQDALHDLRRLGMVTEARELSAGRVMLRVGDAALADETPLAYHLEHFYRAYRAAYDLGDIVVLELVYQGRRVGFYTNQGLLIRRR